MILNDKNQNDIINSELVISNDIEYVFSDKAINRIKTKPKVENKDNLLKNLKDKIFNIENCLLKKNASAKLLSPSHFDSLPKLSLMNLSEIRMSMRSAMAIGGIVICVSLNFISGNIGKISAETKIRSAIQRMHFGKIKCRNFQKHNL